MATFHQKFWGSLSFLKMTVLMVGVFFSIQGLIPGAAVNAQTETAADSPNEQAAMPPSPRLDSNLQYFGAENKVMDSSSRSTTIKEEPSPSSSSTDTPYLGDEGIPVMAETVVEGSSIETYKDPFDEGPQAVVNDPWESFNADVFQFNYDVDRHVLKPVAKGYNALLPPDVQGSLANAFYNIGYVKRFFNSLFQGKYGRAGIETKRFLINSTIGIAGFFDVAKYVFDTEAPPSEDTGQTLAFHGMESGPFLVLPFLPPLTVRDAVGYAGDLALNPMNYFVPFLPNFAQNVERTLNERSLNLETFEGVEESTVDLYGAVRSGYFQRRAKEISE